MTEHQEKKQPEITELVASRMQMFADLAKKVFNEHKSYAAMVSIFTKSGGIINIPTIQFHADYKSKLSLSFLVQYLCIMLGDVDFVIYATEASVVQSEDVKSMEDYVQFRNEIIRRYGSISNCPSAKDVLQIIYDDGEHAVSQSWDIVTTDRNEKALDTSIEQIFPSAHKETPFSDNIFGCMLYRSKMLQDMIAAFKASLDADGDELVSDVDIFHASAETFSKMLKNEAPLIGVQLAVKMYADMTSKRHSTSQSNKCH